MLIGQCLKSWLLWTALALCTSGRGSSFVLHTHCKAHDRKYVVSSWPGWLWPATCGTAAVEKQRFESSCEQSVGQTVVLDAIGLSPEDPDPALGLRLSAGLGGLRSGIRIRSNACAVTGITFSALRWGVVSTEARGRPKASVARGTYQVSSPQVVSIHFSPLRVEAFIPASPRSDDG